MQTIIVPIDFSQESVKGLQYAIPFAKKLDAKIELVYVKKVEENVFFQDIDSLSDEKVRAKFDELIQEYQSKINIDEKVKYIIKKGIIYKEVINQSEAQETSVIIMSTHGGSGFEELFIGSNAFKIASSSSCPVITIRKNVPSTIKNIVLPLDHTIETRQKVPFTGVIAEKFNSKVHVVTISSTDLPDIRSKITEYQSQVCKWLKKHNIEYEIADLTGSNITDEIIEYAEKVNADLISIMTEQVKSLSNMFLGSFAQQMIYKSKIPVLLTPTRQMGVLTESFKALGINY